MFCIGRLWVCDSNRVADTLSSMASMSTKRNQTSCTQELKPNRTIKLEKAVAASARGFPRKIQENRVKIAELFSRNFGNSFNSRILSTGKGKPAANLGSTLPGALSRPSVWGVFGNPQLQPS